MKNILTDKVQRGVSWVRHLPIVTRFRRRYPRFTNFIARRVSTNDFTGLPLTVLLLISLLKLFLLSHLTESVMDSEGVVKVDKSFTAMLFNIRSEWLSQVLYVVTQLGTGKAVAVVGAVATIIFLVRRRFMALVIFWLVMAGMGLSIRYGKKYISRERPGNSVAYYLVEKSFSFPSGHATTAAALYGMCAYFLYRHYHRNRRRIVPVIFAIMLALLVGFTRIYLGVHYLSDVLAGFLLGGLWLLLGISLMEMLHRKKLRYS